MNGVTQFANVGQIHLTFFMESSEYMRHFFFYNPRSIRKISIIDSHIGLYK